MKIQLVQALEGTKIVRVHFVPGAVTELAREGGVRILEVGIGEAKKLSQKALILLCRKIVQEAKSRKVERLALVLSDLAQVQKGLTGRELVEMLVTQALLAEYSFDTYKTEAAQKNRLHELIILGPASLQSAIDRGSIIATGVNDARTLANTPGGAMTPTVLAEAAQSAAKGTGVRVSIFDKARIEKLKMGALLGVAKGSSEEPRFIVLEYRGGKQADAPVVLVGKGVTFDSGGINLKPTGALDDMHMDMSGAALVLHTVIVAARLGVKKNLVALIPAVENMVSGTSYRPGDILRSMSGTTIEVTNTDAEGRVILADALTYAKRFKPKYVIDVATLTGAAMVALGQRANAVFSDTPRLVRAVFEASESTGEPVWQLPLWEDYATDNKATFGDIANSAKTRYGGAITGALFLKHFAKEYAWMHIDMAPRMIAIDSDLLAKGSTGEPMRLLVQMVQKL